MVTRLKLTNGRIVVIEQTISAIRARYEGEQVSKNISTDKYVELVRNGTPIGGIN